MTSERWKKVEELFQAALDLPVGERAEFLRDECGEDAELLREVERLVTRYEAEETFLESPVWTDSQFLQSQAKRDIAASLDEEIPARQTAKSHIGERIGVYRLTEELGKGGMGVVYAAERADGEFYQKVAVKLIKRGMDTDFIVKRFRFERQILANLNHPNIARLLDGGTTENGSPYFIMEFIEGAPVLEFCRAAHLDLRRKLELFLQISRALEYAHRKKIIHRDIKPSNILVTADGEPKLLDFGIAKILDAESFHESAAQTATAMRLMTPEYASPEQIKGETVTAASDQYSLGVLLYELLTGARPYKFPSRAPHEIARVICEEIPSEPSSGEFGKIITDDAFFAPDPDLCRKLDRIVLKTLRKNAAERYASVADFTADVERFLRGEAIRAESLTAENSAPETSPPSFAPAAAHEKSIAVLPFRSLKTFSGATTGEGDSGAGEDFLPIGLADALITRLSNARQLVVRPTSSVLKFSANETDSFAAGKELNVRFIVEGGIARTEKRIRVSIQLLDVENRSTVWAEKFDEDYTDVLTLEDAISARVADALAPQLTTRERADLSKRGTDNAAAYEAYLRGRYYWNLFTEEGFRQAISFLKKAVEFDPNYAQAHAAIADYYNWLGMMNILPAEEFYPPAKSHALRAVELDDKLSDAHAALGLTKLYGEFDWKAGEREMLRAIELNPNNSVAHLWLTHALSTEGRIEESLNYIARAIELDPASLQNYLTEAWAFYFARRFDEALAKADEMSEKFPVSPYSYFAKSCFLSIVGKGEEALQNSEKALELSADNLFIYGRAQALATAGRCAEALKLIESAAEEPIGKRYVANYHTAVIYCLLNEKEKAFDSLDRALAAREGMLIWTGIEPLLDLLRDDRRYLAFLRKINHPTLSTIYQNAASGRHAPVKDDGEKIRSAAAVRESLPISERLVAPRRAGIKQGVFLIIVSFLLLPILVALVASIEFLTPIHLFLVFLLVFGGGLTRVIYAFFFEPKLASAPGDAAANLDDSFSSRPTLELRKNQTGAENIRAADDNKRRRWLKRSLYGLAAISLLSFGYLVYHVVTHLEINSAPKFQTGESASRRWRDGFVSTMNVRRLTTSGKAREAALAPDGGRIAYVVEDAGRQSLWLRPLDSDNHARLVAPEPVYYSHLSFSPDGKHVYYVVSRLPERTLYRVAVAGGAPEKISGNVLNLFAISRDGRRIVYDNLNTDNRQHSLFIAELDAQSGIKSARTLFVLDSPNYFPGGFSFSPDGEKIVYPRSVIEENREVINLFIYDLQTRTNERLGATDFDRVSATAWRASGEEIVISARETDTAPHQLWVVSYPSGEAARLTNDFTNYYGASITADSSVLATTKIDEISNIWTADLAASDAGYESKIKQITDGNNRQDGINGVNWTRDGRILYAANSGAERGVTLMNADGASNRQIALDAIDPKFPALTGDNRYLIYADEKDGEINIWRLDLTNKTRERISARFAVTPTLAPDDQTVVYSTLLGASSNKLTIHRKPLAGGAETPLTAATSVRPVVSPDNRFVACNYAGAETGDVWQIAVLPLAGGEAAPRIIKPYQNKFFRSPQERPLAWSPDGRFLYFLNNPNNVVNIFRVAVEGNQPPAQMTHFKSGEIFDFAVAPDGRSAVIARGATASDIVIFRKNP